MFGGVGRIGIPSSLGSVMGQGGGGGVVPIPALRQIGTRSFLNNQKTSSANPQAQCRTKHYIRRSDSGPGIRVTYYNGYVDAALGVHTPSGGVMSIKVNLEDDVGNILGTFDWGGSSTGVIASGALGTGVLDAPNLPDGAQVWLRPLIVMTGAVGVPCMTAAANQICTGEAMNSGATVTDQTGGGTITNNGGGLNVYPLEILGLTTYPTFLLLGDSRVAGSHDNANSSPFNDVGNLARSIGPKYGYINLGVPSIEARGVAFYNYVYHQIAKHCTHGVIEPGTNDINNAGVTDVQVAFFRTNIRRQYPRLSLVENTLEPRTTSTDGWATTANQTPIAAEPSRLLINAAVRAQAHFVDTAQVNEAAGGVWVANRTADGIHGNSAAGAAIVTAGVIDPVALGALNLATHEWSPFEFLDGQTDINGIVNDLWVRADETNGDATGATWQPYNNDSIFTGTGTAKPVLTPNSYGTKPGFVFDGVNDKFVASGGILDLTNAIPGFSIGVVASPTFTGAVGYFFHASIASASAAARAGLFFNADTSIGLGGRTVDTDAFGSAATPATNVSGNPMILTGTINPVTGVIQLYLNGTLAGTGSLASTGAAFPATNSNGVTIGSTNASTFPYKGLIAEEVVIRRVISSDDRQRLEGYLAWNWGLTSLLPSNHPYKNSPPTVS